MSSDGFLLDEAFMKKLVIFIIAALFIQSHQVFAAEPKDIGVVLLHG